MTTVRRFDAWLVLAVLLACSEPPPTETDAEVVGSPDAPQPNVIVVDDLRFDEFGAGGHPYLETPNIDRLAAEGAMFSDAFHAVPLCSPNRASILTGQYPWRHGIIDNVARDRDSTIGPRFRVKDGLWIRTSMKTVVSTGSMATSRICLRTEP